MPLPITAVFAGLSQSTSSTNGGGLENFPRFLENWGGTPARIRGSLVVGHMPVYHRWPRTCCNAETYSAPNRDWGFDQHLNTYANQPPGAPTYDVAAVLEWRRQ